MRRITGFAISIVIFAAAASIASAAENPPDPPREFRGVWVASVRNMDWPSKKGLSTEQQKAELRAMMDRAAALHLNAVIFQVRPMADALYESKLEPWSAFLTGTLGKAPSPEYDPLQFAIDEAHAHGLQLHAWFNPYRALEPSAKSPIPADHVIKSRPDLVKRYGKHYWLNPTNHEVEDYTMRVILDVVRRYDIDGVHIDDYFYPYPERDADGRVIPFPDDDTWAAYQQSGGTLSRDDWRRAAINHFVERMYRDVKQTKPWIKVGVSPIGIWRPGNPPGATGFDAYTEIYADTRLWLRKGWCDYFAPQIYWRIGQPHHDFGGLLAWWSEQNTAGKYLWPGLYSGLVTGRKGAWPASEIVGQIKLARQQAGVTGQILFNMRGLVQNSGGIDDALETVYTDSAVVPPTILPDHRPPPAPSLQWKKSGASLEISDGSEETRLFVVRVRDGEKWSIRIRPAEANSQTLVDFQSPPNEIVATAIDRAGAESAKASLPAK